MLTRRLAMLAPFAFAAPARAQSFPAGTIRLVVPLAAGGAMDTIARSLAVKLQERLGVSVIVENITGGGTLIAAKTVAKSAPDGHTLLIAPSGMLTTNLALFKELPYDPRADFIPVAHYVEVPFVLVVNAASPIRSIADLARLAKEKPGQLTYASTGIGQVPHLAGEMAARQLGIGISHVPYRGAPPALLDVVAGHVTMTFTDPSIAQQLIADGKIRALGVTSKQRAAVMPDIPPLAEAGLAGFEAVSWHMLLAPAGTPQPVIARLHVELTRAIAEPAMRGQLVRMGLIPYASEAPEALPAFLNREISRWGDIVRQVGIAGTQ